MNFTKFIFVYSPATWTSTTPAPPPNATVIKTELPNGSNTLFVNSTSSTMTGTYIKMLHLKVIFEIHRLNIYMYLTYIFFSGFQPTLSALNQGTKMETNDIDLDDIGALFMKNSSPNVTLGKSHNS